MWSISERWRRRGELQFKPTTLVIEKRQRGEEEFFESAPKGETRGCRYTPKII